MEETGFEDDPELGRTSQLATVEDFVGSSCDDGVVAGLGRQISEEIGCMAPGALVEYAFDDLIRDNGGGVVPFLSQAAVDALHAAAANLGAPIHINSGFRTVAAQYLLYRWWGAGRCNLTLVAEPGSSNHESGRALDIQNYGQVAGVMGNQGWSHPYPGNDPWHFDHNGSPDIRGMDVHAFQRLWNRNNPGDRIDEDGVYGPQTGARLAAAPAEGFPIGSCAGYGASLVEVTGAGSAPAGAELAVTVELTNTGGTAWQPGTTFLGTTQPNERASAIYHPSWPSAARAATVDATTAPGETGRFSFTVQVPADAAPGTAISELFGLVEEGVAWFGPSDIGVNISVTEPGEDDDGLLPGDDDGGIEASCAAAGGSSGGSLGAFGLVGLAALVVRRRRR